jgi:hypothetical protein
MLFSKPCQRQYELLPSIGVKKSANQKKELPVAVMFGNGS